MNPECLITAVEYIVHNIPYLALHITISYSFYAPTDVPKVLNDDNTETAQRLQSGLKPCGASHRHLISKPVENLEILVSSVVCCMFGYSSVDGEDRNSVDDGQIT